MFSKEELELIQTSLASRRTELLTLSRSVFLTNERRADWERKVVELSRLQDKVSEMTHQLIHEEEARQEKQRSEEVEANQLRMIYEATDWA